jgi:hypothetical protein
MEPQHEKGRLDYVELAAIDLTIAALQASGQTIEVESSGNPREIWAQAMGEAHGHLFELSERDREILGQIKTLVSQLESRTSLSDLVNARGKIIAGG